MRCAGPGRSRTPRGLLALAVVLVAAPALPAVQPGSGPLEDYLEARGLTEVLATHLAARLEGARPDERTGLAERLGRLYVRLLESAADAGARERVEGLARSLLERFPEADSFELRLNLAKVNYLFAEEIAERHRLRLASEAERDEAERLLRTLEALFQDVGAKVNRHVESLEHQEEVGVGDPELLRAALADARRTRSLAMYYAGWAGYYTALLTGVDQHAAQSLVRFGWLLNAPEGRPAAVDRLPEGLLKYEHVARAALGCALCESLRGNHDTARRWLDAVAASGDLPAPVREQLFARRVVVLARAARWPDLEWVVQQRRRDPPEGGQPAGPSQPERRLEGGEARLIAVLTLDALDRAGPTDPLRSVVEGLAQGALADLVAQGQIGQVLDLVEKYGSAQLGTEGFIVNYVRGVQSYEQAREQHRASGEDPEQPAGSEALRNEYRLAAGVLAGCLIAPDAAAYAREQTSARTMTGLALFYAGDFKAAAEEFQKAHAQAADATHAEEALWLAVVALDRAVETTSPSLAPERDRVAALYLKSYASGERAAKLLLRQTAADMMSDERAVDVLLGIPPDSALFDAARRQAARVLYRLYRRAHGTGRDFAAVRFVTVAEQVLARERERVAAGDPAEVGAAATNALVLARQILDAVLGTSTPDLARAEAALGTLDAISLQSRLDLSAISGELTYRRFQIALARSAGGGDGGALDRLLEELHGMGGQFSAAADRALYQRALDRWQGGDAGAAGEVVRHGARVIAALGSTPEALREPGVAALHDRVAEAAASIWRSSRSAEVRDVAIRIDRLLIDGGVKATSVLRRFAEMIEAAGRPGEALDAWRTVSAGEPANSDAWFEARYQLLRLLWALEPERARESMTQHATLYPTYGPEPWGPRLRELHEQMLAPPPPAPPPAAPEGEGP